MAIGPPRSGTTLIANAMMAHSRVAGVMEPWHRRRREGFCETAPDALSPFLAEPVTNEIECLIVKETTTRVQNVDLALSFLRNCREAGQYSGLVVILRCPLTAYLSQVEASEKLWPEKKLNQVTPETFARFSSGVREGLLQVASAAGAQHSRVVTYESFCSDPEGELARLMALVPLPLQPARQLSFKAASGGDPKTREKAGAIRVGDRSAEVAALEDRFASAKPMRFMTRVRGLVLEAAGQVPDRELLDQLALACLRD